MKDLPKNFGAFLLSLGGVSKRPHISKLGCPAIVTDRCSQGRDRAMSAAASTGQLETRSELDTHLLGLRSPAERAFPSRNAPGKTEV